MPGWRGSKAEKGSEQALDKLRCGGLQTREVSSEKLVRRPRAHTTPNTPAQHGSGGVSEAAGLTVAADHPVSVVPGANVLHGLHQRGVRVVHAEQGLASPPGKVVDQDLVGMPDAPNRSQHRIASPDQHLGKPVRQVNHITPRVRGGIEPMNDECVRD